MRQKGKITLKILDIITDTAIETAQIIQTIIESPYGASFGKFERKKNEIQNRWAESENAQKEKQKIYKLLSKLQKDGLIHKEIKNKKSFWRPTKAGVEELQNLKTYHKQLLPQNNYQKKESNEFKIVIFDIPEKERVKRNWLRKQLTDLGFEILQKSVWAGQVVLPENFIDDLNTGKLLDYVQIFAISKSGTLKKLKN